MDDQPKSSPVDSSFVVAEANDSQLLTDELPPVDRDRTLSTPPPELPKAPSDGDPAPTTDSPAPAAKDEQPGQSDEAQTSEQPDASIQPTDEDQARGPVAAAASVPAVETAALESPPPPSPSTNGTNGHADAADEVEPSGADQAAEAAAPAEEEAPTEEGLAAKVKKAVTFPGHLVANARNAFEGKPSTARACLSSRSVAATGHQGRPPRGVRRTSLRRKGRAFCARPSRFARQGGREVRGKGG